MVTLRVPTMRPRPTSSRRRRVHRSAVVTWLLWTPRRALMAAATGLLVIGLGITLGVSWLQYQHQLAAWQDQVDAEQAAATNPAPSAPTSQSPDTQAAYTAAHEFTNAWLNNHALTTATWVDSMRPYATPELLARIGTDRHDQPAGTVTTVTGPTAGTTATLQVTITTGDVFTETVTRTGEGPWLVNDLRLGP